MGLQVKGHICPKHSLLLPTQMSITSDTGSTMDGANQNSSVCCVSFRCRRVQAPEPPCHFLLPGLHPEHADQRAPGLLWEALGGVRSSQHPRMSIRIRGPSSQPHPGTTPTLDATCNQSRRMCTCEDVCVLCVCVCVSEWVVRFKCFALNQEQRERNYSVYPCIYFAVNSLLPPCYWIYSNIRVFQHLVFQAVLCLRFLCLSWSGAQSR